MDADREARSARVADLIPLVAVFALRQPRCKAPLLPRFGAPARERVVYPVRGYQPLSANRTARAHQLADPCQIAYRHAQAAARARSAGEIHCHTPVVP